MKKEIQSLEDIKQLVDSFYEKIRRDDLLAPLFNNVIQNKWPIHLKKMYQFWQTILLSEHTYYGSPFPPHAKLSIGKVHFECWTKIFNENIDEQFIGEKASEAKWRAAKMAEIFYSKIVYMQNNSIKPEGRLV